MRVEFFSSSDYLPESERQVVSVCHADCESANPLKPFPLKSPSIGGFRGATAERGVRGATADGGIMTRNGKPLAFPYFDE
ncbi:hypothetical protein JW899_02970 [Candidatus Uhrbacteria bacterium]|nr:hypothetical protein [Candidatus Uhrbacteria bacterium]